jgi:hypothetical protein
VRAIGAARAVNLSGKLGKMLWNGLANLVLRFELPSDCRLYVRKAFEFVSQSQTAVPFHGNSPLFLSIL